jgi:hypothetical protein
MRTLAALGLVASVFASAPARAEGTVPVLFKATAANDKYHVVVENGGVRQDCDAPCTLKLTPGNAHLIVTGERDYEQDVEVSTNTKHIELYRPSPAVRNVGIGMIGAGAIFFLIGQAMKSNAESAAAGCYAGADASWEISVCDAKRAQDRGAGGGAQIVGGAVAIGGIALLIIAAAKGNSRAKVREGVENVAITPTPGGVAGSLTIRF